jgi:hypothetical protein
MAALSNVNLQNPSKGHEISFSLGYHAEFAHFVTRAGNAPPSVECASVSSRADDRCEIALRILIYSPIECDRAGLRDSRHHPCSPNQRQNRAEVYESKEQK